MMERWPPAPFLVAGPCALAEERVNLEVATTLAELSVRLGLPVVFKASFDKGNRTRADAPRGLGIDAGLAALDRVRSVSGLPVVTDVHESRQVPTVAQVVDALQVPAFLCRQTDLLVAVGKAGLPVNLKKGQWMEPSAMHGAVDKVRGAGGRSIAVTERGSFFGYGDLVVDMRAFPRMKTQMVPTLIDATHAVQRPGRGPQGEAGGERAYVPTILMAAAAAGADGFFVETHPDPATAVSDAASMWPLEDLDDLIERGLAVWRAAREPMPAGTHP